LCFQENKSVLLAIPNYRHTLITNDGTPNPLGIAIPHMDLIIMTVNVVSPLIQFSPLRQAACKRKTKEISDYYPVTVTNLIDNPVLLLKE